MEAMTPSCSKRSKSPGSRTWACSMRKRRVAAAGNADPFPVVSIRVRGENELPEVTIWLSGLPDADAGTGGTSAGVATCSAAAKASSAIWLASSPMAWKPS